MQIAKPKETTSRYHVFDRLQLLFKIKSLIKQQQGRNSKERDEFVKCGESECYIVAAFAKKKYYT